jgi:hypothetical protein
MQLPPNDGPGVGERKLGPPPAGGDAPKPPVEFPDLVGVDGEEAKARIKEAHPELRVMVRRRGGEGRLRLRGTCSVRTTNALALAHARGHAHACMPAW